MVYAQWAVIRAELQKKEGKDETIDMIPFAQILPKSNYVVLDSAY